MLKLRNVDLLIGSGILKQFKGCVMKNTWWNISQLMRLISTSITYKKSITESLNVSDIKISGARHSKTKAKLLWLYSKNRHKSMVEISGWV